jgi:hypothetical protein
MSQLNWMQIAERRCRKIMLRVQNDEVIYNNSENLGKVQDMEYTGFGFSIITPNNPMPFFIPEEDCSISEEQVFIAYHEYYKNSGGIKPSEEMALSVLIENRIKDFSDECYKRTINGIDFKYNDEIKHYSLEVGDQVKLMATYSEVAAGKTTVSWHCDGEECTLWSAEKFIAFFKEATYFIKITELTFNSGLRPQTQRCTTKEEVDAVVWGMDFDEDIKNNLDGLIAIIG